MLDVLHGFEAVLGWGKVVVQITFIEKFLPRRGAANRSSIVHFRLSSDASLPRLQRSSSTNGFSESRDRVEFC